MAQASAAGGRDGARGVAWAVASAGAFSLSAVVGKDLLGSLGVPSLLFWRFAVASALLWAILAVWSRRGGPDPLAAPWPRLAGLGVLFGVLVLVGFLALDRLEASIYIVLVYLYPVVVVLASTALGHPLDRLTMLALVLVTAGVVLSVPDLFTGGSTVSVTGVVLALGQAVLFAGYLMLNSRIVPSSVDSVVVAGWITLGAAVVVAPIAFGAGLLAPREAGVALELALFALIPTVAATTFLLRALRHVLPAVAAMILTLEVALAIVWSVLFLGEEVDTVEWIGALVVITGVVIAQRPRPGEAAAPPPVPPQPA